MRTIQEDLNYIVIEANSPGSALCAVAMLSHITGYRASNENMDGMISGVIGGSNGTRYVGADHEGEKIFYGSYINNEQATRERVPFCRITSLTWLESAARAAGARANDTSLCSLCSGDFKIDKDGSVASGCQRISYKVARDIFSLVNAGKTGVVVFDSKQYTAFVGSAVVDVRVGTSPGGSLVRIISLDDVRRIWNIVKKSKK